ncbi:MAG TPA: hypothetical protein VKA63_05955 [Candidatus Krumholzibacteria bacterium]|nr:hypothetical protein [Candidatus Krumholzibacteria bacterium]
MNKRRTAFFAMMIILFPVLALANNQAIPMQAAVAHYAAMAKTLSQDSTEGIQGHATALLAFMDDHADMMKSMQGQSMKGVHKPMKGDAPATGSKADEASPSLQMRKALKALSAKDLSLANARSAFEDLSAQFIPMAEKKYERNADAPTWVVMNCPAVKADWIQTKGDVRNPYLGSKKLNCGKQIGVLGVEEAHS